MKNLKIGDVIRHNPTGMKIEVVRADHTRYDVDGVPSIVHGHYIPDGVHTAISFGGLPGQPIEDWKEYSVISRSDGE